MRMAVRPQHRSPRRAALVVAAALAGAATLSVASPAHADSSYDATARAVGVDATAQNPSIPVGLVVEGFGPEADAHQTSLGSSDADTSFPYLGDVVPTLPGLLGGIVGVPTPPYPLIAATQLGTDPQTVSYPGVTLRAQSTTALTTASGTAGTDNTGATASARIARADDGTVTATADSDFNALIVGGFIRLSGIHSEAKVVADGSTGALTRTSSTTIAELSVPGLSLSIPKTTPGTVPIPIPVPGIPNIPALNIPTLPLPFGGTTIATPDIGIEDGAFTITIPYAGATQKFAIPAGVVLSSLQALGITATFEAAQQTTHGVIAPVFSFTYTVPSPPANQYFSGPTPVTFTMGGSVASVDLTPITADDSPGGGGSVLATSGGTPATSSGGSVPGQPASTGGALAGSDPLADGGSGLGTIDTPLTGLGNTTSTDVAPPGAAVASPTQGELLVEASGGGAVLGANGEDIYLLFVAVAGLAFLCTTALRLIGVRSIWGS